jgi:hypothetical protein
VERRRGAVALGASATFGSLCVALGALELRKFGAGIGQGGLEVGDVTVRGLEALGRLGGCLGMLARRLIGVLGALPSGLQLGASSSRRELVARR